MNFSWADKQDDKDFILAEDVNALARGVKEAKAYADEQSKESIIKSTIRMEKYTDYTGFGMTETSEGTRMRIVVNASFFNDKIGVASPSDLKLSNYILLIKRKDLERYFTARILGYENRSDGSFTLRYEQNEYGISSGMEGFEYFNLVDEVYFCLMSEDAEKALKKYSDSRVEEAKSYANDKIESAVILSRNISDGAVTPKKTSFFTKIYSTNLLNLEGAEFANLTPTGNTVSSDNYVTTTYIPVDVGKIVHYSIEDGTRYLIKTRWWVFYDKNKNFISSTGMSEFAEIPENCVYMRVSFSRSTYNRQTELKPMVSYGKEPLQAYEPYWEKYSLESSDVHTDDDIILSKKLEEIDDEIDFLKGNFRIVPSICDAYDTTTEYVAHPSISSLDNVYSLYDNLVSEYPDYISKSLLGNVTVNNEDLPMYRYDFTPPSIISNNTSRADICKVLLTNCTHGHEIWTVPVAYRLMLDICNNWRTSELLRTLRFNCHFTIIPIVNPYGFLNSTRKNENGIDVARNFEPDFAVLDESADNYGGTTPNSEQSSQLITALSKSEHFDFMFDLHNYGSFAGTNKSGYVVPCIKRSSDIQFGRLFSLWANAKTLKFNDKITDLNTYHFHSVEKQSFDGYLTSVFPHGMTLELLYGWGDDELGTTENAQRLAVELLGGAVLIGMAGYERS